MATYYEFYNPATGDRQYSQTGVPPGAGYIQVGDPFPFYPSISSTSPVSQQVFTTPTGQSVSFDPATGNIAVPPGILPPGGIDPTWRPELPVPTPAPMPTLPTPTPTPEPQPTPTPLPQPPTGGVDPGFYIDPPTGGVDPGFYIDPPPNGTFPVPMPSPQPPTGGWGGGMFPPPGDPTWRPGQTLPMPRQPGQPVPEPQPEQPIETPGESPNTIVTTELPETGQGLTGGTPPPTAPGGPAIVGGQPPAEDVPIGTTPTDTTASVDPGASFVSAYTDVGDEAYSPYEQYQRRVLGQLPQIPYGTDAYKRLESAAMRRYAPTLGQFLLSAYPRAGEQAPTFTEWMQSTPGGPNFAAPGAGTPGSQTFQDIVGLSSLYDPTQTTGPLTEQQRVQMAASPFGGFLTGQPRAAITSYMLGGPQRGYLGQLMAGQAQRLQDLYGKERMRSGSEVFGAPEQGYFSWLSRQLPQTGFGAPATTPATTTFGTPANVPVTPAEVVNPITNTPVVTTPPVATTPAPDTKFADPYGGTFVRGPGGMMNYTNPEDLARIRYTG
jgi:hypothetical protein